ncbi:MAG: EF-Tu/IF-2/RF-3 family GTPase, partial [Myxococcota bacterium]
VAELLPPKLRTTLLRHLDALQRKELLEPEPSALPSERAFRFRHVLIQEAAYRSLPKERRGELHERFAGWLDGTAAAGGGDQDEIVGYHLEQGYVCRTELGLAGDSARALALGAGEKLSAAAGHALARNDLPAAVNLLMRATSLYEAGGRPRLDLLVDLGADDGQLDFPVVFASAKEGTAVLDLAEPRVDLRPLLETMVNRVRAPKVDLDGPLQFQAVTLDYDDYLGRLVIGRVARGRLVRGASVVRVGRDGATERFRVTKLLGARGLERVELDEVGAGELGVLAGVDSIEIGDTICDPDVLEALPRIHVDPPTVRVHFSANTSPLAGREGRFVTSRQIDERLRREALGNVAISVVESDRPETFLVAGRGELQLGILIETMRREGYEFSVSRPEIIAREIDGARCEPVEDVVIETPDFAAGAVMEKLAQRRGRMEAMEQRGDRVRMHFVAPSRGLFGYRTEFLSDTRGEGVLHRTVRGYE